MTKALESLTEKERKELKFSLEYGDAFNEIPVSIEEFIDSDYYLNLKKQCRKRIKKELIKIFGKEIKPYHLADYTYALITGGIGIGKTFTGGIVFAYLVYRMLCLKDPQEYYGFARGTRLAFMNMSTSRQHALDVLYGEVKARVEGSKWFMENAMPDPNYTNLLKFPKNIYVIPGDSSETTFEGYNIIGGIIDEADSHKITPKKDYAEQGFDVIDTRLTSRSNPKYGHIGLLLVLGSKKKQEGFIAKKFNEFKTKTNAYAVHIPIWEARDADDYTGEFFYFHAHNKEIVKEPKGKDPNILKIPVEYKDNFIRHPDKSLRDLAGFPPYALQPFFSITTKLQHLGLGSPIQCPVKYKKGREETEQVVVGAEVDFHEWFVGKPFKYFCHFDLGINKDDSDFCGFAMGHVGDWKMVDGEMKKMIFMDLMLRIVAPPGGEIQLGELRKIIYFLKFNRKFNIYKVTFDGWQSTESIQQLKKKRIRSEVVSVDRTNAPYDDFKETLYEDRFITYHYLPVIDECLKLEYTDNEKVDHPPDGSKDVSDACASVTHQLLQGGKNTGLITDMRGALGEERVVKINNKVYVQAN